jgi:hypothetical protein
MPDAVNGERLLDWSEVRDAIHAITSNPQGIFESNTVANALDVGSACEPRTTLPFRVKKGYWAAVVLWWQHFELEVFGDPIEVYRFRSDGATDIWYEEHKSGGSFTARFLEGLAGLTG